MVSSWMVKSSATATPFVSDRSARPSCDREAAIKRAGAKSFQSATSVTVVSGISFVESSRRGVFVDQGEAHPATDSEKKLVAASSSAGRKTRLAAKRKCSYSGRFVFWVVNVAPVPLLLEACGSAVLRVESAFLIAACSC